MIEKTAVLIRKNTITNYMLVFLKLVGGILVIRWMIAYLGTAQYGFWALLWSIFIYVLLLDFGFSKAAQKSTAEQIFRHDIRRYNRIVSAVFSMQWIVSLTIILITLAAMIFLPQLTQVTDETNLIYFRMSLLIFGIGIAITFPTGMFPEILVGLKLIYLRSRVLMVGRLIELFGILLLFRLGGELMSLVIFTVLLNFSLNLVMYFLIRRNIPGFRLSLVADFKTLRELMSFSAFSYLSSIANLIIRKTDRLLLSIVCGLEMVGIYQLGTRLPDMAEDLTMQYQDNITPYTAQLCREKCYERLQEIVLPGIRWTVFLAAGGVVLGCVLASDLLLLLFNCGNDGALIVCQLMLVNVLFQSTIRGFAVRMMNMSGFHRRNCVLCWTEAVLNLGISLFLMFKIGLVGVVIGTLAANAFVSTGFMLPFCAMLIRYPFWKMLGKYYLLPLGNALAAGIVIYGMRYTFLTDYPMVGRLFFSLAVYGVVYLLLCGVTMFSQEERRDALATLKARFL